MKHFNIYVNDIKLLFTIPATKAAAKQYIRTFLKSTHMGGWVKVKNGYEYNTTIGKYYRFIKEIV